MGDHLVLCVDRLSMPRTLDTTQGDEKSTSFGNFTYNVGSSVSPSSQMNSSIVDERVYINDGDEEEPLIQTVECRICQEEDDVKNLEAPCACSGSLKVYFFKFFHLAYLNSLWLHWHAVA